MKFNIDSHFLTTTIVEEEEDYIVREPKEKKVVLAKIEEKCLPWKPYSFSDLDLEAVGKIGTWERKRLENFDYTMMYVCELCMIVVCCFFGWIRWVLRVVRLVGIVK